MDGDIEYIIYFVFFVIYILSRAFKKKKPKRQAPQDTTSDVPESTVTFEDLLREFGADIPKEETAEPEPFQEYTYQEPEPEPVPEPEPQSYTGSDDYAREVYERSIEMASMKAGSTRRKSLLKEEQDDGFERDIHYRITSEENIFMNKLHNPQTLRDAIIYTEILNRKY